MANKFLGESGLTFLTTLIHADLDKKVNTSDVVNDLNTEDSTKPLSALQGKNLNTAIQNITADSLGALTQDDIVDNLESNDSDKVLSAKQGKILFDSISSAGNGDMMKARYDTNDDGKVDKAERADEATHASNADNATNADNAAHADEADHADTADTADEATMAKDSEKLGGVSAADYATQSFVVGLRGVENGFAPLDSSKQIPSQYLPSYVDDVVEGYYDKDSDTFYKEASHDTPIQGERDKIYVDITEGASGAYRWSGTKYTPVVSSDMVEINTAEITQIWNGVS